MAATQVRSPWPAGRAGPLRCSRWPLCNAGPGEAHGVSISYSLKISAKKFKHIYLFIQFNPVFQNYL